MNDFLLMRDICKKKINSRSKVKSFVLNRKKASLIGLNTFYDKKSLLVDDENRLYDSEWKKKDCVIAIAKLPIGFWEKIKLVLWNIWCVLPIEWKSKIWRTLKKNYNYPDRNDFQIRFTQTRKISLKNAVVWGDLSITVNDFSENDLLVDIQHSFIFGKIEINTVNPRGTVSISMYASAIDEIVVENSTHVSLNFNNVSIGLLHIDECSIKDFALFECYVEVFQIRKSEVLKTSVLGTKINVKESLFKNHRFKWTKNPPAFINIKRSYTQEYRRQTLLETIDFLKKNSMSFTQNEINEINYQHGKIGKNIPSTYLYRMFGGMQKPYLISIYFLFLIIVFAFVYYCHPGSFGPDSYYSFTEIKKFLYSLYFSTITMTTVGYGDLHPSESIMIFAAAEGFMGILLGGAFLVSITRKYFTNRS